MTKKEAKASKTRTKKWRIWAVFSEEVVRDKSGNKKSSSCLRTCEVLLGQHVLWLGTYGFVAASKAIPILANQELIKPKILKSALHISSLQKWFLDKIYALQNFKASNVHYVYYITRLSSTRLSSYISSTRSKPQINHSSRPKLQPWTDINMSPDLSLALAHRSYEGRTWNLDHMFYYPRRVHIGTVRVHCCLW